MIKLNLIDDVASLTSIQVASLRRLVQCVESCISHYISESIESGNEDVSVDVGVGTLIIHTTKDSVSYRFEPSKSVEENSISLLNGEGSVLIKSVDSCLINKIMSTYKELF